MIEPVVDIVCMGEPMIEFTRIPDPQGRPLYLQGFGGDTSNCAIAAARQGARTGYLTAIGNDRFGDQLLALWAREGIDTAGVVRAPDAPTAVYFIEPAGDGRDFTYYRERSAASRMTPDDVPDMSIGRAGIFMTSAISQAISDCAAATVAHAMAVARRTGSRIAYDTNLRLNLWPLDRAREVIHRTASGVDILMPSIDEARILTGLHHPREILAFYRQLGPGIIALKCGADGAHIVAGDHEEHVPAPSVDTIDASGAGDTFCGSFLARLVAGDEPVAAARYAVVAASLSTTGLGAVTPIPAASAVRARLAEVS